MVLRAITSRREEQSASYVCLRKCLLALYTLVYTPMLLRQAELLRQQALTTKDGPC